MRRPSGTDCARSNFYDSYFKKKYELCLPVTVEISSGDLVAVTGSKLLAGEDQLNAQLALGFLDFGEDDHLAGAVGSRGSGRITDFTAEILARRDAHSCRATKKCQNNKSKPEGDKVTRRVKQMTRVDRVVVPLGYRGFVFACFFKGHSVRPSVRPREQLEGPADSVDAQ